MVESLLGHPERGNDERMLALTLRIVARSVPTQSVTPAGNEHHQRDAGNSHRRRRRTRAQPRHPGDHDPRASRRIPGHRDSPRVGRPRRLRAGQRGGQLRQHPGVDRSRCESCRTHRRHVPAHLADPPEPSAARARARTHDRVHRQDQRRHEGRAEESRAHRRRRAHSHRRRRHAELWQAAARRRGARRRHSEDDGQRRLRDRLLHRLQHVRDAHDRAHAPPAHVGRLARAVSRHRGLRPVRGLHRAAADDGRRRRPMRHPRAPGRSSSS